MAYGKAFSINYQDKDRRLLASEADLTQKLDWMNAVDVAQLTRELDPRCGGSCTNDEGNIVRVGLAAD